MNKQGKLSGLKKWTLIFITITFIIAGWIFVNTDSPEAVRASAIYAGALIFVLALWNLLIFFKVLK